MKLLISEILECVVDIAMIIMWTIICILIIKMYLADKKSVEDRRAKMDLRIIEISEHYGIGIETDKCVEELSELADALTPDINANHIDEELADVLITVCEQIHLRGCGDKVKYMVDAKLNRQIKRMEEEK